MNIFSLISSHTVVTVKLLICVLPIEAAPRSEVSYLGINTINTDLVEVNNW